MTPGERSKAIRQARERFTTLAPMRPNKQHAKTIPSPVKVDLPKLVRIGNYLDAQADLMMRSRQDAACDAHDAYACAANLVWAIIYRNEVKQP
jgi:uncharacterized protein (DUF3084 family)